MHIARDPLSIETSYISASQRCIYWLDHDKSHFARPLLSELILFTS